MWIRSTFWTGRPKVGHDDAFRRAIDGGLAPALNRLPDVDEVKVLWPRRRDGASPDVHCQILVCCASLAAVERMLASPERVALRLRVQDAARLFDGVLSHIDYEVADDDLPQVEYLVA